MQRCIYIALVLAAIIAILLPLSDVSAQASSQVITLTEARINESYLVTNPSRRAITNRSVDLQPDQVVISETITRRRLLGAGTTSNSIVAIFTPSISHGRIYWTLDNATLNGEPISQALIAQFNDWLSASWSRYFRQQLGSGRVTDITITDNEVTISLNG